MKLIATLTTLPSRIDFVEPVLISILNQSYPPDEVHLQIPTYCQKEEVNYKLPNFLSNYEQVIVVEQDKDYGPATKWLPALDYLRGDDVLLLIMDDDCHYTTEMVSKLYQHYQQDQTSIYCSTGGVLKGNEIRQYKVAEQAQKNALTVIKNNRHTISVDTVQGFSLVLFHISLIPESLVDELKQAEITHLADDIILSGLFEKAGIRRVQISPYQVPQPLDHAEINPIHGDGRLTSMTMKAFNWVQRELSIWENHRFIEDWEPSTFHKLERRLEALLRRSFIKKPQP